MLQGNGRVGVTIDVLGVNAEQNQGKAWSSESHPSMQCRPTTETADRNADDVDSVLRYDLRMLARLVSCPGAREDRIPHVEPRQLPQQQQPAPARHMVIAIGSFLPADSRALFLFVVVVVLSTSVPPVILPSVILVQPELFRFNKVSVQTGRIFREALQARSSP